MLAALHTLPVLVCTLTLQASRTRPPPVRERRLSPDLHVTQMDGVVLPSRRPVGSATNAVPTKYTNWEPRPYARPPWAINPAAPVFRFARVLAAAFGVVGFLTIFDVQPLEILRFSLKLSWRAALVACLPRAVLTLAGSHLALACATAVVFVERMKVRIPATAGVFRAQKAAEAAAEAQDALKEAQWGGNAEVIAKAQKAAAKADGFAKGKAKAAKHELGHGLLNAPATAVTRLLAGFLGLVQTVRAHPPLAEWRAALKRIEWARILDDVLPLAVVLLLSSTSLALIAVAAVAS